MMVLSSALSQGGNHNTRTLAHKAMACIVTHSTQKTPRRNISKTKWWQQSKQIKHKGKGKRHAFVGRQARRGVFVVPRLLFFFLVIPFRVCLFFQMTILQTKHTQHTLIKYTQHNMLFFLFLFFVAYSLVSHKSTPKDHLPFSSSPLQQGNNAWVEDVLLFLVFFFFF